MVTHVTPPEIDWSTFPEGDGEPMAETSANAIQMVDLQFALQTLFDLQERRVVVGGNQLMYYNPDDGREHVSPDVYAVFDRTPPAPPSWRTWERGKFPDLVFEITSPSTQDVDLGVGPRGKRRLYARLGVREYYIFDPQGETAPVFQGYELRGDSLEPLPFLSSGGIASALLGAELRPLAMAETDRRPAGTWLRVVDPATGQPIPISEEVYRGFDAERQARVLVERELTLAERERTVAEQARAVAEQRLVLSEQARAVAERELILSERERTVAERELVLSEQARAVTEHARVAAEERAARAEAALHALRADQARYPEPDGAPENG